MPIFQAFKKQSSWRILVAVVLWATCTSCVSVFSLDNRWDLRFDGIGPLKVGMRYDEVSRLLGHTLERTDPRLLPTLGSDCEQIPLDTRPGIALMFIGDILRRVDVYSKDGKVGGRTESGIGIGDSVQRVLDVYPDAKIDRHEYVDSEYMLTASSPDGKLAIRFLTLQGKVEMYYAGESGAVRLTEGCL